MASTGKVVVVLGALGLAGVVIWATTRKAEAAPPPGKGNIVVTSTPAGAEVQITPIKLPLPLHREVAGSSPVTIEVEPGTYIIGLRLSGYNDYPVQTLVLAAGETKRVEAVLVAIPATPPPAPPNQTTQPKRSPCPPMGDVDGDGWVSQADAELIAKYYTRTVTLTAEQLRRADVNGDGIVNVTDSMFIMQYLTGQRDTFPVCNLPPPVSPAQLVLAAITTVANGPDSPGTDVVAQVSQAIALVPTIDRVELAVLDKTARGARGLDVNVSTGKWAQLSRLIFAIEGILYPPTWPPPEPPPEPG